jgi:hypothetical protein
VEVAESGSTLVLMLSTFSSSSDSYVRFKFCISIK